MRRTSFTGAVATAFGASCLAGVLTAAAAGTPLYWRLAPPPGARVLIDGGSGSGLRIEAAATDPRERVTLSLLGSSPARLDAKAGNPAVGVLWVSSSTRAAARPFAVTFVARTSGPRRLAITRTVIVSLRTREVSLVGPGALSRWAYVLRESDARAAPTARAPVVGVVATATSDALPNLVRLLAQQRNPNGSVWVRVALASLPNGQTGWVRRVTLSDYHVIAARLVVDTERLTLTLYHSGEPVFHAQVGVGLPRWPTPHGIFYIREKLTNFRDPSYGPVAFGTNARSPTLTDWPGGGIVGIHGTNVPRLIPGRISHGCIRLRNADILRLERLLPLGTPLVIR